MYRSSGCTARSINTLSTTEVVYVSDTAYLQWIRTSIPSSFFMYPSSLDHWSSLPWQHKIQLKNVRLRIINLAFFPSVFLCMYYIVLHSRPSSKWRGISFWSSFRDYLTVSSREKCKWKWYYVETVGTLFNVLLFQILYSFIFHFSSKALLMPPFNFTPSYPLLVFS